MTEKEVAKLLAAQKITQNFFKREDVQAALKELNFEDIYMLADDIELPFIGNLHWLFENAGINPLDYLTD